MKRVILAAAFAAMTMGTQAVAAPVIFDISIDGTLGPGSGTFTIDDSLIAPNATVSTGLFDTVINYAGLVFTTPFAPASESVIFDNLGFEIAALNDITGSFVDFEDENGNSIFFEFDNGPVPGTFRTFNLNGSTGTFDISRRVAVAAVPLPATLPLLAGGLGLMGLMGWRRRRKVGAI